MKNLFQIQNTLFTEKRYSKAAYGEKYVEVAYVDRKLETADRERYNKAQELQEEKTQLEKEFRLPNPILFLFLGVFVIINGLLIFLLYKYGSPSDDAEANLFVIYGLVFGYTIVSLVAIFLLTFLTRRQREKIKSGSAYRYYVEKQEKLNAEACFVLGIPDGAAEVDGLFVVAYHEDANIKEKRGTIYNPRKIKLFREGECLCLGNMEYVIKIPLAHIRSIQQKNKAVRLNGLNNGENTISKEKCKQYHIRKSNVIYLVKPHYDMIISNGTEEFHILITCYDIDSYIKVTGKAVS